MARLREEREALGDVDHRSDPEARLREKEIDAEVRDFQVYVRAATGLHRQPRPSDTNISKQAADAVSAALRRTYKEIADSGLQPLADWLRTAIITGQRVRYQPTEPVEWECF